MSDMVCPKCGNAVSHLQAHAVDGWCGMNYISSDTYYFVVKTFSKTKKEAERKTRTWVKKNWHGKQRYLKKCFPVVVVRFVLIDLRTRGDA